MKNAIIEAVLVVLGVVLALAANEWRESARDHAAAMRALASIKEEIETNMEAVSQSRNYHSEKIQILREQQSDAALNPQDFPKGFIFPARVSRSAWSSASETGAFSHLQFEHVLEISRIYDQQKAYEQQIAADAEILYRELFEKGIDGVIENPKGLATMLGSLIYRDAELLKSYEEFLE